MNSETAKRLNRINERFYRQHARNFDEARRSPWPGWERVLSHAENADVRSILDVGCGNGRFGLLAASSVPDPMVYTGVDASEPLLAAARTRGHETARFLQVEFSSGELPGALGEFDLVVCFGVMHHIASEVARRRLVLDMSSHVAPGGLLAVSFWQFGAHDRFEHRRRSWQHHNRVAPELIDLEELEAGDHLLFWGEIPEEPAEATTSVRYCHYADPSEVDRLLEDLAFDEVDRFEADGRSEDLNLYRILRRSV